MKDIYTTSDPIVFTLVAVAIFLFTSFLFLIYDHLNQTRQRRIMASALQSNAIVSNLFPTVVRDRVLGPKSDIKESAPDTQKRRLQTYLQEAPGKTMSSSDGKTPIAEFFSDTTVCK